MLKMFCCSVGMSGFFSLCGKYKADNSEIKDKHKDFQKDAVDKKTTLADKK